MTKWLDGRVALVTGASRGIGAGIAKCLAEEGAKVALAARTEAGLAGVARAIEGMGGQAMVVPTDVSVEEQVIAMCRTVESAWGPVEILVNNAGVMGAEDFTEHYPEETRDWEQAYRVNTLSRVWACQAVLPSMKQRRWGKIVNISSVAALEGFPVHVAYNSTRAAEVSYTQALAREVGPFNINVNVILPGLVYTDISLELWKHIGRKYGSQHVGDDPEAWFQGIVQRTTPLKRAQTVEDIGWLTVFLCSLRAENISCQAINVDGGMRMH